MNTLFFGDKMRLYYIKKGYYLQIKDLDFCIPIFQGEKEKRPFIGPVIEMGDIKYFAPLSSPKKKHRYIHSQMDCIFIQKGKLGIININNMIPVQDENLQEIRINMIEDKKYQKLLFLQWVWCMKHRNWINANAYQLYKLEKQGMLSKKMQKRCCHFYELERRIYLDESNKVEEEMICYRYA